MTGILLEIDYNFYSICLIKDIPVILHLTKVMLGLDDVMPVYIHEFNYFFNCSKWSLNNMQFFPVLHSDYIMLKKSLIDKIINKITSIRILSKDKLLKNYARCILEQCNNWLN